MRTSLETNKGNVSFSSIELSTKQILKGLTATAASLGIMIGVANADDKVTRAPGQKTEIILDTKEPISIERIMTFLGEYNCSFAEQKGDIAGAEKCRSTMAEIIKKCEAVKPDSNGNKICETVSTRLIFRPLK